MEKLDRGDQTGVHRLLEVDSAKQQVLQGLAGNVDREDQLVVLRLVKHLVHGVEDDVGQEREHHGILAAHPGDPHVLVLGGNICHGDNRHHDTQEWELECEVNVVCSEYEGKEDDADIREPLHQGREPGLAHHGTVPGAEGPEVEGLGELSGQL